MQINLLEERGSYLVMDKPPTQTDADYQAGAPKKGMQTNNLPKAKRGRPRKPSQANKITRYLKAETL